MLLGEFFQRSTVDFVRYVVNTFQFGNGFIDYYNQSQVVRRRLTFGDNAYVGFIDRYFYYVDVFVVFDDAFRQIVVLVMYRGDCIRKLLFYYVVYGYYLRADIFQFGVELVGNMFIKIEIVYNVFLN